MSLIFCNVVDHLAAILITLSLKMKIPDEVAALVALVSTTTAFPKIFRYIQEVKILIFEKIQAKLSS